MKNLFCVVIGGQLEDTFKVQVEDYQDIEDVKILIEERGKSALEGVKAANLILYCVSVGNAEELKEAFRRISQGEKARLIGFQTVAEVFPLPAAQRIHVIVERPGKLLSGASVFPYPLYYTRICPCTSGN